jgi:hypothetical protein
MRAGLKDHLKVMWHETFMNSLRADEFELVGSWIASHGRMAIDATTERINWLVEKELIHLATDATGWENLYCDPKDGRYWELTFPLSELHGGGPPKLTALSAPDALKKYPSIATSFP